MNGEYAAIITGLPLFKGYTSDGAKRLQLRSRSIASVAHRSRCCVGFGTLKSSDVGSSIGAITVLSEYRKQRRPEVCHKRKSGRPK